MNSPWNALDWLQYLVSFALVIALLLGMLWFLKRLQDKRGLFQRPRQQLQVAESLSIGTRQKVLLLQVGSRQVLLGVTPQAIQVLDKWSASTPAHGGIVNVDA
jgi:flagellar protein FliO/FliZ